MACAHVHGPAPPRRYSRRERTHSDEWRRALDDRSSVPRLTNSADGVRDDARRYRRETRTSRRDACSLLVGAGDRARRDVAALRALGAEHAGRRAARRCCGTRSPTRSAWIRRGGGSCSCSRSPASPWASCSFVPGPRRARFGDDRARLEPPQPLRNLPGLAVVTVLALAGGVSLGPENPIIAINVALIVARSSPGSCRGCRRRLAVLLAGAATIGALFGTPVAAALLFTGLVAALKTGGALWDRLFLPLVAAGAGADHDAPARRPVVRRSTCRHTAVRRRSTCSPARSSRSGRRSSRSRCWPRSRSSTGRCTRCGTRSSSRPSAASCSASSASSAGRSRCSRGSSRSASCSQDPGDYDARAARGARRHQDPRAAHRGELAVPRRARLPGGVHRRWRSACSGTR